MWEVDLRTPPQPGWGLVIDYTARLLSMLGGGYLGMAVLFGMAFGFKLYYVFCVAVLIAGLFLWLWTAKLWDETSHYGLVMFTRFAGFGAIVGAGYMILRLVAKHFGAHLT